MEVLLTKDVQSLGAAGDVKRVRDGYARNFLIPRGLAQPATEGLRKQSTQLKQARERRQSRELASAQAQAKRIGAVTLTFKARAGESGRLYGSITAANIADKLEEALGHEVDRRRLRMEHSLRDLGEHQVMLHLAQNVDASFKVVIEPEGALEKDIISEKELAAVMAKQVAA